MYLQALATAFPDARYTQNECWEIAKSSPFLSSLKPQVGENPRDSSFWILWN